MANENEYLGGETIVNEDEAPQQPININTTSPVKKGPYNVVLEKNIRPNPLSKYSSYSYIISLYMITPDAYDAFVFNGRKDIEIVNQAGESSGAGAYLIARSGGINNTTMSRAPGFQYDMYIDNLMIKSALSPNATSSPTTNYEMSFTLMEPYGFSFISNLKRAKDSMDLYSKTQNIKNARNTSRQFFVIGIEFAGYDGEGKVISGKDNSQTFKRYYDIYFTEIKFKIDGKMTVYQVKAAPIPIQAAFGQKRGIIDKGATQLTGTSVRELCNNLMDKLNKDQIADVPSKREFPNTYEIEFLPNAEPIAISSIVTSSDVNKINWPMPNIKNTIEVNPGIEIKANPNNQARTVAFNRDTPIIQAIQQIINQSTYLIEGLKTVYNTDPQPDKEGNTDTIDSNKRAKWFNISPIVKEAKWDRQLKDFAFKIVYQIQTYETPVIVSTNADSVATYYGPFKRYDYWYTGQNTEILGYEQTMNNSYFIVALDSQGNITNGTGGDADIAVAANKRTPVQRLGKLNLGMEAQNNYVTSLVDPGAYAIAKVKILGDPDLLSNDMASGNPELENTKPPFFGSDGYSLDPRQGQVFVEIDFKEAVDYESPDRNTGLLKINKDILFWEYPKSVKEKVKGICFMLREVDSRFQQGKFTQDLTLHIATFPPDPDSTSSENSTDSTENTRLINRSTAAVGLMTDKPVTNSSSGEQDTTNGSTNVIQQNNLLTTISGVANDDGTLTTSLFQVGP